LPLPKTPTGTILAPRRPRIHESWVKRLIMRRGKWAGFFWSTTLRLVFIGSGSSVLADELLLPSVTDRGRSIEAAYRFAEPVTAHGFLDLDWSDTAGRVVERRRMPLDVAAASHVTFTLDMRRAATIKNQLVVRVSFDAADQRGDKVDRDEQSTFFAAIPADDPWSDYQVIIWQGETPAGYAGLKTLGLTAGMLETNHRDLSSVYTPSDLERLVDADLRCYLENIATDFYSPYHKWSGDRPPNWRFLEVKRSYRENRHDLGAFIRQPSLSDAPWLQTIRDRLVGSVQALRPYRPLFYNLGDETGIGDLSAFWDFDLSQPSLAAMRDWLKDTYGSLAALNRQWDTVFGRWEEVVPMTTDEAINRSDENFSAWADFKGWMDIAFARAIRAGSDAIHAADRDAKSAIEGTQIPGWGGYDYSHLAHSVDAMELYDYGDNVELARSFNPALIMLTTSSKGGPLEAHRVWRELLRGTRGLILWDDKHELVGNDGVLGERGREAARYLPEIREGLGALLINSRRHTDPVGVLYSPASMRLQWLLDRRATGEDWIRRNASTEYEDNGIRAATRNFAHALRHFGLQYRFISSAELGQGELQIGNYSVLILPHTIALAATEAQQIREFVERGGTVIADNQPGLFDEHGRRAAKPLLSAVFDGPPTRSATSFSFGKGKAIYLAPAGVRSGGRLRRLTEILNGAGVEPLFPLTSRDGRAVEDVETYVFHNGNLTIVALQRDYVLPSHPANVEAIAVTLPRPLNVYDLRAERALGTSDRLELELDSVEPAVLALSEQPIPPPTIVGPGSAHRGDNAEFFIGSGAPVVRHVVHLDVVDPDGLTAAPYSGNLIFAGQTRTELLPLAFNDKIGVWKLRVRDLASGATTTAELQVQR